MKSILITSTLLAAASFVSAAAPISAGEVAPKWKTTGLQQANTMGGGEAPIPIGGKFRVFVLMGQSNTQGYVTLGKITASAVEKFYTTKTP